MFTAVLVVMKSCGRVVGCRSENRWSGAGVGEDGFDLGGRLSWVRREQVVESLVLVAGVQHWGFCTLLGCRKLRVMDRKKDWRKMQRYEIERPSYVVIHFYKARSVGLRVGDHVYGPGSCVPCWADGGTC